MARLNSPKKSSLPLSGRWPQRWKDRPHAARSSGSLEDRIGAALASVLHAEALPEPRLVAALARVARARKAAPSRVWRVRLAAFASVLLMGTGVVFAREGLLRTARECTKRQEHESALVAFDAAREQIERCLIV